jgi:hypothetical protein
MQMYSNRQLSLQLSDERRAHERYVSDLLFMLKTHNWQEFAYVHAATEPQRPSQVYSTDPESSEEYEEPEVLIDLTDEFARLGIATDD